jgi:hypothetical protein
MEVSYQQGGFLYVKLPDGSDGVIGSVDFDRPPMANRVYLYSPNQRKTIIAKMEKLIDAYDTGDCPTALRLLLEKIKEVG